MKTCLVIALALVLVSAARSMAAGFTDDFLAANKLYAEGKFAAAAAGYGKILQTGAVSPALLFNYGNAEFKSGNVGPAVAAFRRAELLAPRDAEIRANLGFVRDQAQIPVPPVNHWSEWLGQLTLNEWTLLAAAALWLTCLALAARQFRPALAPKLRGATAVLAVLTLLFGAATALQAAGHFLEQTAVVVSDHGSARSGPFEDAQKVFAVRDGLELPVTGRYGNWVQVANGPGRIGWLPADQVVILPGA